MTLDFSRQIRTLADFLAAGLAIRSYCSAGQGHSHLIDLQALVDRDGPDVEVDYAFKLSLTCPTCGAPGGGTEISSAR